MVNPPQQETAQTPIDNGAADIAAGRRRDQPDSRDVSCLQGSNEHDLRRKRHQRGRKQCAEKQGDQDCHETDLKPATSCSFLSLVPAS